MLAPTSLHNGIIIVVLGKMLIRKRNNTSSIFDILFYFVLMLGYLVGCWMNEVEVMVQIVFTKVPKVHPQTKTMLFDPKCMIFEHTSMFKNLEFLRIFIDFNEIFRFS